MLKLNSNRSHLNPDISTASNSDLIRRKSSPQYVLEDSKNALIDGKREKKPISSLDSRIHKIAPSECSESCLLQTFESGLIQQEIKARLELEKSATKSGHVTGLVRVFEKQRRTSHAIRRKSSAARFHLESFSLDALRNEMHRRLQLEPDKKKLLSLVQSMKRQVKNKKQKEKHSIPKIRVTECAECYTSSDEEELHEILWNHNIPASKRLRVPYKWETNDIATDELHSDIEYETKDEEENCEVSDNDINNNDRNNQNVAIYNASFQQADQSFSKKFNGKFHSYNCIKDISNNGINNTRIRSDSSNFGDTRLKSDVDTNNGSATHTGYGKLHLTEDKYCLLIDDLQIMKNFIQNTENDFKELSARTKIIKDDLLLLRKLRIQVSNEAR